MPPSKVELYAAIRRDARAGMPGRAIEFRPTLERQRDDAAAKGQVAREHILDGLLSRLDGEAS